MQSTTVNILVGFVRGSEGYYYWRYLEKPNLLLSALGLKASVYINVLTPIGLAGVDLRRSKNNILVKN